MSLKTEDLWFSCSYMSDFMVKICVEKFIDWKRVANDIVM